MRLISLLICFCLVSVFASAQTINKSYTLKIPALVTQAEDKTAYAYKAQEELRLLHNQKSKDCRDGKITKKEWDSWKEKVFDPKQYAISNAILENRKLLKKANIYTIDLENCFEEKTP